MTLLFIFIIAVALAVDAFAVSFSIGLRFKQLTWLQVSKLACVFALFQGGMPIIGWVLASYAQHYITQYDHWVAFCLLALVGSNMIMEAIHPHKEEQKKEFISKAGPPQGLTLIILSIAISLDAMAIGMSIAFNGDDHIYLSASVIAVVCFILSMLGLKMGQYIANLSVMAAIGDRAYILGGLVLWGIGINILYEHGVFR